MASPEVVLVSAGNLVVLGESLCLLQQAAHPLVVREALGIVCRAKLVVVEGEELRVPSRLVQMDRTEKSWELERMGRRESQGRIQFRLRRSWMRFRRLAILRFPLALVAQVVAVVEGMTVLTVVAEMVGKVAVGVDV